MRFEKEKKLSKHGKNPSDGQRRSERTNNANKNYSEAQAEESAKQTLVSMAFSLILVGLALIFVMVFHNFLKGRTYTGPADSAMKVEDAQKGNADDLEIDESFTPCYLIVKEIKDQEFCATEKPGVVTEGSKRLENGEILEAVKKGSHNRKDYYCLEDHTYVEADEDHIQIVDDYIPLEGYIVITYISSAGVRLRSWIDFDAENVVRSAYVGDKIDIKAMITLEDGRSAFQTTEGLFITNDSRYFTDSTNLKDKIEPTTQEESTFTN